MEPSLPATGTVSSLSLEAALLTRRDWLLPDNDQPAQLLRRLEGGLSNISFLLQVGGDQLVLRLDTTSSSIFDLDRFNEVEILIQAAQMELAPNIIYASAKQGLLVTRYIPGVSCSANQTKNPGFIVKLARLLQQVHLLNPPALTLNPKEKAEAYWTELYKLPTANRFEFEFLRVPMNTLMDRVWQQYPASCCCHNDLVSENIVHHENRLFLLDWEYAALGDPYFDLAALVLNFNMNQQQTIELLAAYEGQFEPGAEPRLRASKAIYLYLELLWYQLQGQATNNERLLQFAKQRQPRLRQLLYEEAR